MRYINCTINITKGNELHYEKVGQERHTISGTLKLDPLRLATIERLNYWINYAVGKQQTNPAAERLACTLDDLKVLGLHLYQLLFSDEKIRTSFEHAFRQVRENCDQEPDLRLRLCLVFEAATERLASLPWEFLLIAPNDNLDTGVFVAGMRTELLLTRRIEVPELVRNLVPDGSTLSILLVACRPTEIDGVQLDTVDEGEIDEMLKTIEGLGGSSRSVTVNVLRDPSYDELKHALSDDYRHIVHYIGHGSEGKIGLRKSDRDDDYDIGRGGKQFRWITAQEVRALFIDPPQPRLVFLSACKGAASGMVESFKSTARELVYAGIPGVVAMQFSITNAHAKLFARRFYEEIGQGKQIDEAVNIGRKALGELYPPWRHPRFATPVVYLQSTEPFIKPSDLERVGGALAAGAVLQSGARSVKGAQTTEAPQPRTDRKRRPGEVTVIPAKAGLSA